MHEPVLAQCRANPTRVSSQAASISPIGQSLVDEGGSRLILTVKKLPRVRPRARISSIMTKTIKLSEARRGDRGVIVRVGDHSHHGEMEIELERRLLELGFVEGAQVELLHEGLFGRDPIVMKVDDMRVGLRRREAASLLVQLNGAA